MAEAARLYEEGCSSARIGERLGFNGQTIGTTLRKLGVRIRDPQG
ncbi:helix-turn-helix transcriptional regulator [Streptomyces sp. SID13031]|nr:helix-turn-helix transcriptional regulator [Streptomyces sp. SID13031]